MADFPLMLAASLLLLAGHAVRAVRWTLLFEPRPVRPFPLLLSLSVGYAVNALLPFRIGEIVRAYYASAQERIHFPYVAASVVTERTADLAVVGLAAATFAAEIRPSLLPLAAAMLGGAAAIVAFAFAMRLSAAARRLVWTLASIFSDRLRFAIADLVWSVGELLAGGTILRWRFIAATFAMWGCYGASYIAFAVAVRAAFDETLLAMLGNPLTPPLPQLLAGRLDMADLLRLGFALLPLVAVIAYGLVRRRSAYERVIAALRGYAGTISEPAPSRSREHFKREGEYEYFLASLFSGDDHAVARFGLRAIDDGLVHRLFNGGSDAITALVEVEEKLLIRKFAIGGPAEKLRAQAEWLRDNIDGGLPLVTVAASRAYDGVYRYDMPLMTPATDLYDVIHTAPIGRSQALLTEIAARIDGFHRRHERGEADKAAIARYLEDKAAANAVAIASFAATMLGGSKFTINDEPFDLSTWAKLTDMSWLAAQIARRTVSALHGDLTVENIIVSPASLPGWYIIDPNPGNIFDTPLIDWAKLMQSLHLGYEGLNRGAPCILSDNAISLSLMRSQAYSALHADLERLIVEKFGADGLREVYFHELVNYLRLTPYKIRQDKMKGLTFFACTALLLRRYLERLA